MIAAALPLAIAAALHAALSRAPAERVDAASAFEPEAPFPGSCREAPRRVLIDGRAVEAFALLCGDAANDTLVMTDTVAEGVAASAMPVGAPAAPETVTPPAAVPPRRVATSERRHATHPVVQRHVQRARAPRLDPMARPSQQKYGP